MSSTEVLRKILQDYPDVLDNRKKLQALFMDYFPQNRLLVNTLLMAYDEGITSEMKTKKQMDNILLHRYAGLLEQNYGVAVSNAETAVKLWAEALNVITFVSNEDRPQKTESNSQNEAMPKDIINIIDNFSELKKSFKIPTESVFINQVKPGWLFDGKLYLVCPSPAYYDFWKVRLDDVKQAIVEVFGKTFEIKAILKEDYESRLLYISGRNKEQSEVLKCAESVENLVDYEYIENYKGETVISRFIGFDEPEIIIPNTYKGKKVHAVGGLAFKGCNGIEKIVVSEGIEALEFYAFRGCKGLREIQLPATLKIIEEETFKDCIRLEKIIIPEGTKIIRDRAFMGCTGLEKVVIQEGTELIGNGAFQGCKNLKEIQLPATLKNIGRKETENSGGTFYCCSSLKEITIPNQVEHIGVSTFSDCTSLTSVKLPQGLTIINKYAFCGCSSLQNIIFPKNIKAIKEHAFSECKGLKEVVLPYGLKTIGNCSFENCVNLKSIYIPETVTSIHAGAFKNKSSTLKDLTIYCEAGSYAQQYARSNNIKCAKAQRIGG